VARCRARGSAPHHPIECDRKAAGSMREDQELSLERRILRVALLEKVVMLIE
jgi:hypothetical protein